MIAAILCYAMCDMRCDVMCDVRCHASFMRFGVQYVLGREGDACLMIGFVYMVFGFWLSSQSRYWRFTSSTYLGIIIEVRFERRRDKVYLADDFHYW